MFITIFVFAGVIFAMITYTKNNSINTPDKIGKITNSNENENLSSSKKVKAIDFKLKDLNGNLVSLSDLKGKNVYLNFWATWCGPCRLEMPEIQKLYEETKNTDLVILAVDIGEDIATVKPFITNNKYSFNVLLDSDKSIATKYEISAIPTSIFINKEGNIISRQSGALNLENMKSYIKGLSK